MNGMFSEANGAHSLLSCIKPSLRKRLKSKETPLDALFRPQFLVGALVSGEMLALAFALTIYASWEERMIQFGLASLGVQWTVFGTLGLVYLLRRKLGALNMRRIAWVCLGLFLSTALLVSYVGDAFLRLSASSSPGGYDFVMRMLGLAFIFGLMGLLVYQNYWQSRQLALRAKQAELDRLRARVDPHFLFNTLNTATALIHTRPQLAEDVLLDLSDLFRAALSERPLNTLEQEVELTRRYLEIEQLRLGDRLRVEWDLPSPLSAASLPTLSLQPLVENAVRHGIERLPAGGAISILVTQAGELRLRVDNPVPPDASSREPGHQIGIAATRARVESLSDGRGRVEAGVRDGRYVAEIILPPDGVT